MNPVSACCRRHLQPSLLNRHYLHHLFTTTSNQQRRAVSVSTSPLKDVPPVSFGPATDDLIQSYLKRGKRKTGGKGAESKKRKPGTASISTGSIEITLHEGDEAILATRASSPGEALQPVSSQVDAGSLPHEQAHTPAEASDMIRNERSHEKDQKALLSHGTTTRTASKAGSPSLRGQPLRRSEPWQTQKDALQKKFGDGGWNPRKKLSPDAVEGLRHLHAEDPVRYSTAVLSEQFKVSAEAIRRILKSKWSPDAETMEERRQRWARRHDRIWDQKTALGLRPPRRGNKVPDGPEAFDEELRAKQLLGQI